MFKQATHKQYSTNILCAAVLLTAFSLPAHAVDPGSIKIASFAETEITVVDKEGKTQIQRTPVDTAVPGDEIIYTTTFENISTKPADNIVITNPVPNDTTYRSASGANTTITFSVDGGSKYDTADKLTVTTIEGNTRPAAPSDYTHLSWTYQGELDAGKTGRVSFRTVVK